MDIPKRKQRLLLAATMVAELREEAARLDGSLSFVLQSAWKLAREQIAALPIT